jgi:hypothetical protein
MKLKPSIPWIAAALTFVAHVVANPHYGYFRDELYFIICGRHPAWGYVDQPPLVPLVSAGTQLFGHSLIALRATAALCGAGAVYTAVRLVQQLRGGAFAQIFAAVVAALTPVLVAFSGKVGPDMIELWMWPLCGLYVLKLIDGEDARWWLAVGATLGIACEGKYSVAFFALALFAGILLTPARRIFETPWFAAGLALAGVLALPNFSWQATHGFPMLELLQNGQHGKNVILSPLEYLAQQLFMVGPLLAPLYVAGLIWALRSARTQWIAWTYVVLIALMIAFHGKNYYPGAIYALLAAPCAVAVEQWTANVRVLRPVALAYSVAAVAWMLPFVVPILPLNMYIGYQDKVFGALHVNLETEHGRRARIQPDWADMQGWEQLASLVGGIYDKLGADERAHAVIVANNYGEASAIAFFRPDLPVISGHNNYWLWGTRGYTGNVTIDVNGDCGAGLHLFRSTTRAATFKNPLVMQWEDNMPIMTCRGIKTSLANLWPAMKRYI